MKLHAGLVVVALSAVGCATETVDTGATVQAATNKHCPDPETCTETNGGGVYTQELGRASLGPTDLMITHFINQGGSVGFAAREWDDGIQDFRVLTNGMVNRALYNGEVDAVTWIEETATVPTVHLVHYDEQGDPHPRTATGDDLFRLQLILEIKPRFWTISFKPGVNNAEDGQPPIVAGVDQSGPGPGLQHVTLRTFDMFWNPGQVLAANPAPYCRLAKKVPHSTEVPPTDPVVFQGGIGVNAVTAVMTPNMNNYITMSCLHGAIATARWWGYFYRGTAAQTTMFEAAMHMKRASYCGDATFFTRRNTRIRVRDGLNPQNLNEQMTPTTFEASWGRASDGTIRALCYNKMKRRRPGALYPPVSGGEDFDGDCASGDHIDDCAPNASEYGVLADERTVDPTLP